MPIEWLIPQNPWEYVKYYYRELGIHVIPTWGYRGLYDQELIQKYGEVERAVKAPRVAWRRRGFILRGVGWSELEKWKWEWEWDGAGIAGLLGSVSGGLVEIDLDLTELGIEDEAQQLDELDKLCKAVLGMGYREAIWQALIVRSFRGYKLGIRVSYPVSARMHPKFEFRTKMVMVLPPSIHPAGINYELMGWPERIIRIPAVQLQEGLNQYAGLDNELQITNLNPPSHISARRGSMMVDHQIKSRWEISIKIKNSDSNSQTQKPSTQDYAWIQRLLDRSVPDGNKRLIWRVLAPYLILIKKCDFDTAFKILRRWAPDHIKDWYLEAQLRNSIQYRILPKSLAGIRKEWPDIYDELIQVLR